MLSVAGGGAATAGGVDTAAEMPALGIPGRRGAGLLSVSLHLLARLLRDCAQRMLVAEDAGR